MSTDEGTFAEMLDSDEHEFLQTFLSKAWKDAGVSEATDTDARLDWLLEKLGKRQAEIAANDAIAKARHAMIEDWQVGENAKLERAVSWIEFQIRELCPADGASMEKAYGKKSRILPFGSVGYRASPATVEIFDEPKAIAWAKAHKLEVKVKESVSKTELKKAIEHTQDPPDGFGLIPGGETFFVRVDDLKPKGE